MPPENAKRQTDSALNFLQLKNRTCRVASIPFFKIVSPFSVILSFSENISTARSTNNGKRNSFDYHPSPSGLTSMIHRLLRALSLLRTFAEFSVKPIYPNMVLENFQILGLWITRKCISDSKNIDIFTYSPLQNSPQGHGLI